MIKRVHLYPSFFAGKCCCSVQEILEIALMAVPAGPDPSEVACALSETCGYAPETENSAYTTIMQPVAGGSQLPHSDEFILSRKCAACDVHLLPDTAT